MGGYSGHFAVMSAKPFSRTDIPVVRNGDLAKSRRSTSGQQMLGLFEELTKRYSVTQLKSDLVDPVTLLLLKRSSSPILLPGQDPSPVAGEMYNAEQVVRKLADLNPKIIADIRNVQEETAVAKNLDVEELPMLCVSAQAENRVRFFGAPTDNLFEGLLKAVRRASTGENEMSVDLLRDLGRVGGNVHLRVFVTPSCPACRPAILSAHCMALASQRIRADVIDATVFIDLAERFEVHSVPTIVLNDRLSVGRISDDKLLEVVFHAADPASPAPKIPYLPYPSCGRL